LARDIQGPQDRRRQSIADRLEALGTADINKNFGRRIILLSPNRGIGVEIAECMSPASVALPLQ
jgi:hypothetical protein